jgi:hypothetical protein
MAIMRQLFPKWKWFNLRDDAGRLDRAGPTVWMQSLLAERGSIFLLTPAK